MNVDFTPEQKPFVQRAIESGRIHRPEEAAEEAFSLWIERERLIARQPDAKPNETSDRREVAARMLTERARRPLLDDDTIRELIDEGRD